MIRAILQLVEYKVEHKKWDKRFVFGNNMLKRF